MDILITLLTIVEVLICLLLILIVLMQRPRQEGLGASFGEGVTSQVWGAQTTNVLQKGTGWLAAALFLTTVGLAYLIAQQTSGSKEEPLFKSKPVEAKAEAPKDAAPAAATPAAPAAATPAPAGNVQVSKQPGGTVTVKPADAKAAPKVDVPKAAPPAPVAAPKADAPKAAAPAPAPAPKPAEAPKADAKK